AVTDVPGSSAYFLGGVISYADQVKREQLGVSDAMLRQYGAVSEETAAAMASGVRQGLHADIGVSITGVAGAGAGGAQTQGGASFRGAGRGGLQAGWADLYRHRGRGRDDAAFSMDRRPLGQPASLVDRRLGAAGPGSGTLALTVTQIRITVERTGQADHEARGI